MNNRLNKRSFATQKIPNDTTLANITSSVCSAWSRSSDVPMCLAKVAPTMEKAMPMADMVQKGTTSFKKWDRPCLPQAHLRLSQ